MNALEEPETGWNQNWTELNPNRRFGLGVKNQVNNLMSFFIGYSIKGPPGLLRPDAVRYSMGEQTLYNLYRNINEAN